MKKEIISQQNNGTVLLNLWQILKKLLHLVLLYSTKNLLVNKMIQRDTKMIREDTKKKNLTISQQNNGMVPSTLCQILEVLHLVFQFNIKSLNFKSQLVDKHKKLLMLNKEFLKIQKQNMSPR